MKSKAKSATVYYRHKGFRHLAWMAVALMLATSGCERKADVQGQLIELETAFSNTLAAMPAEGDQTATANVYVKAALAAMRTNDFAAGIMALQLAAQTPGVSPEQLMAIQGARQAMTQHLVDKAAQGDTNAKAALAAIEQSRSQ